MSYSYPTERPWLFTDEGQRVFLRFRDKALAHLRVTGAFTGGCAIHWAEGAGDSFKMVACVDRLVELGEVRKVEQTTRVSSQGEVFVIT